MSDESAVMRTNVLEVQHIRATTSRPILYSGARIRSADPVIGTLDAADLLLGGDVIVGVGPGLITATEDDNAFVVDCSGFEIIPVVTDRLAIVGRRSSRTAIDGALTPGRVATFGIVARTTRNLEEYDLPHDFVAVVEAGAPVAWNGVWLEATDSLRREVEPPPDNSRVGFWVDETEFLTQELRADGRYDETRGGRPHAFQGAYWINGDRIDYLDDLGFWAYGKFTGDTLEHAGYRMHLSGRSDSPA